jgi:hypothetical protein
MKVDDDFVKLKTSFQEHVREEVLIDVVVQVLDGDFDSWRLPDVVLVDNQPEFCEIEGDLRLSVLMQREAMLFTLVRECP